MGRRLSAAVLTAALFAACSFALAIGIGVTAWAQVKTCPGHPACVGGYYNQADGYCYSGPAPFTNAMDHWRALCADGETLDRPSGTCRPATCGGSAGGCQERPVCPPNSTYSGPSTSGGTVSGTCQYSNNGFNDHEVVPCDAGWTLDTARGVCRRCPNMVYGGPRPRPMPLALPDLTLRDAWLADPRAGKHLVSVHQGQAYYACFIVANIGSAPSGPFRVAGGGLGLSYSPYQDHASLAPGASRQGCLSYPTTPPPGSYKLGLEADSQHVVHESNEANNNAVISVTVVP
jgi:hypothetical protein